MDQFTRKSHCQTTPFHWQGLGELACSSSIFLCYLDWEIYQLDDQNRGGLEYDSPHCDSRFTGTGSVSECWGVCGNASLRGHPLSWEGKVPEIFEPRPDYRNPPRCKPSPMSRLYTMEWHGTASEVSPVMGCWREDRGLGLSETQHKRRRTPATVRPSPCGPRECRLSSAPRFFFRAIGNNCGK